MEEVRILKRIEEPPAPASAACSGLSAAVAAVVDQRALCFTGRIGPQVPTVVPTKKIVVSTRA
jgi:hypothetical protein